MRKAIASSGSQLVTVALRRIDLVKRMRTSSPFIPEGTTIMVNTVGRTQCGGSGAHRAHSAGGG
jgi:thiazole synthase ThiGH ThiG subunit